MNLQALITYNGLSINTASRSAGGAPTSGYRVLRFAPEPSPPTGYLEKRALTDGLDAGDVFLGGRTFGLVVQVFGSSEGDFWDKAQDLFAAFTPTVAYNADTTNRGFLDFDFSQPTADIATWPTSAYPNGIPLRYYMRPSSGPSYVVERIKDNVREGGHAKAFNIQLIARDPRKYLNTELQYAISASSTTGTYRGDYQSAPIITFSVSATGHSAFTLTVNGFANVINLSGVSSGTFTFDYGKRSLVDSTNTSRASLLSSVAGFPLVGPSTSEPSFSYTNPTGISSAFIKWREAWA